MTQETPYTVADLRKLSPQDFKNYGVHNVAYVKPVTVQDQKAFSIHAADGTPLTVMDDFNAALIVARQNDLEPMTVH